MGVHGSRRLSYRWGKSILDEIELDPSERKALEEFRAQRERKRGGTKGSPIEK